ncbi:hypothetical protein C9374_000046 [Naegleria lovaniensis]|uniref:Uncharacterized protein n=1 Tax=Naegleria lovaniensis TaxID=51637 RepID=A0AA88GWZ4_NAELO|nr:uncharacterized protein C9374_000046 [Naegleria lovaniensis]KAG2388607.1 hypothetical protein C9374_000046 [Naegleria lovaniensis]
MPTTSELGKRKRKKKALDEDFVDIDDSRNKIGEEEDPEERLDAAEDDGVGVQNTSSRSSKSKTVSSKKKKKQSSSTSTISSSSSSERSPVSSPVQQLFQLHTSSSRMIQSSHTHSSSDHEDELLNNNEEEEPSSSPTPTKPKPVLVSPTASLFLTQVDQESNNQANVPIATVASSKRRFKTKSTLASVSAASSSPTTSTGSPSSDTDKKGGTVTRKTLVLVNQPSLSSAPISTGASSLNAGATNNNNKINGETLITSQNDTNNLNRSINSQAVVPSSDNSPYNLDDWSFITNHNGISVEFKKSRDAVFVSSFPKVLYTLTWKHKYDLKIVSEDPVFRGVSNKVMIANVQVDLVMGRDFTLPSYEPSKASRQKSSSNDEDENGRKKKSHKKPSDVETITLTSASKENDNCIILRFGINRTYCSKRFNYAPFRLKIDYTGTTPFTLYSPIFHSFAKKLNESTVKNVNEILKRIDDSLVLPLQNAEDVSTPFQSVFCDTIPNASPAPSSAVVPNQVIFVVQNGSSTTSNNSNGANPSDTNKIHEDASLLLSLGAMFK